MEEVGRRWVGFFQNTVVRSSVIRRVLGKVADGGGELSNFGSVFGLER